MNNRSIFTCFSDRTVAEVRSMEIHDRYEYLLEGTRSALSRHQLTGIKEKADSIEKNALTGTPTGEYVVIPELVPEKWGGQYVGDCIKEYSVTVRYQIFVEGVCLELAVIWDASREEFMNFWESLDAVTRKIDYRKYAREVDPIDLG